MNILFGSRVSELKPRGLTTLEIHGEEKGKVFPGLSWRLFYLGMVVVKSFFHVKNPLNKAGLYMAGIFFSQEDSSDKWFI